MVCRLLHQFPEPSSTEQGMERAPVNIQKTNYCLGSSICKLRHKILDNFGPPSSIIKALSIVVNKSLIDLLLRHVSREKQLDNLAIIYSAFYTYHFEPREKI